MANEENNTQQDGLDFESAKEMTVGEAVQKEAEIKAGITDDDDVLDKYIKQHRDEVASQKFESDETKVEEPVQVDTAPLDTFIAQQREAMGLDVDKSDENTVAADEVVEPSMEESRLSDEVESLSSGETPTVETEDVPSELETPEVQVTSVEWSRDDNTQPIETTATEPQEDQAVAPENQSVEESTSTSELTRSPESDGQRKPLYKRYWTWGAAAIILVGIGGAVYWNVTHQGRTTQTTASQSSTSSSSSTSASENNQAFTELYNSFFSDDAQNKPQNSMFSRLSELKTALDKLDGTSYHNDAQTKYDSLNKQIQAIQAVNDRFTADVVVNGERISGTVKQDANFDDISEDTLNTGNASLDAVLREAIADGRAQLASQTAQETTSEAAASPAENTATTEAAVTDNGSSSSVTSGATTQASARTVYGIQDYSDAILQTSVSRVPINQAAIADSTNSAWDFNPGVLERIVATSQERGYITGNNYILQKVNIINGNGYYNMYKPDGTYLFTLNCKTGYFVGNAAGHSDALDY